MCASWALQLTLQQFKESQQRGLLKRMRPPGDYKSEGTIVDWTVVHDDGLPTLSEVFESLPPEIGFDIEVKMAIHDQEHTPSEEVRPSCRLSWILFPTVLVSPATRLQPVTYFSELGRGNKELAYFCRGFPQRCLLPSLFLWCPLFFKCPESYSHLCLTHVAVVINPRPTHLCPCRSTLCRCCLTV